MFWIKDSGFCSVIFSFTIIFELYYRFRLTFIERGIRIIILFRKHVVKTRANEISFSHEFRTLFSYCQFNLHKC